MTSIRKVSQVAGVSVAIVSRTMSHPDQVRTEAREKAFAVVVLVPNIANPFFSRVIRGIEQGAQPEVYAVLLGDTQGI